MPTSMSIEFVSCTVGMRGRDGESRSHSEERWNWMGCVQWYTLLRQHCADKAATRDHHHPKCAFNFYCATTRMCHCSAVRCERELRVNERVYCSARLPATDGRSSLLPDDDYSLLIYKTKTAPNTACTPWTIPNINRINGKQNETSRDENRDDTNNNSGGSSNHQINLTFLDLMRSVFRARTLRSCNSFVIYGQTLKFVSHALTIWVTSKI